MTEGLTAAAANYQVAVVNPHCAECAKPCCRLDPLVLELDWKQLKALWQIEESRAAFDRRLSAGKGPEEIRAMDGQYFAHRKICPAYDEAQHSCRVYGQDIKPAGCTDFPVYQDRGSVIADLRCEAVDLDGLATWLARSVGPEFRIVQSADEEFPFMVSMSVRRVANTTAVSNRTRVP
jgi:Fe-S-cluster containining protein